MHVFGSISDATTSGSRAVRKGDLYVDEIAFFGFHAFSNIFIILQLLRALLSVTSITLNALRFTFARDSAVAVLRVSIAF